MYFGTASVTLDEADSYYAVAIYRDGDLSQSASVQVRALDMTALYGKDYALYMYSVKVTGSDQTLLQTYLQGADTTALWLWLLPMLLSSAAVILMIQKKRAFQ